MHRPARQVSFLLFPGFYFFIRMVIQTNLATFNYEPHPQPPQKIRRKWDKGRGIKGKYYSKWRNQKYHPVTFILTSFFKLDLLALIWNL